MDRTDRFLMHERFGLKSDYWYQLELIRFLYRLGVKDNEFRRQPNTLFTKIAR